MLIATLVLPACAGGGDSPETGGGGRDTLPPTVVATNPARQALAVPLDSPVSVAFSEAMNPASITAEHFAVTVGGVPVAGSVSYANAAATFTPDALLSGGVTYTARVTTGVTDKAGNALTSEYSWTFTPPVPQVAYVTNKRDATVSTFWVDSTSGRLYPHGQVDVVGGLSPIAVAVDPSKRFAFVVNYGNDINPGSGSVTTFRINTDASDAGLGALTQIGSVAGVLAWPQSLGVEPSGAFVYAANYGGANLAEFRIKPTGDLEYLRPASASTRPLTATVGSIDTGTEIRSFVYAADSLSGGVTAFSIDPASGILTRLGNDVASGLSPRSAAVDPNSRYLYVANRGAPNSADSHSVAVLAINQTTGALSTATAAKVLQAAQSAPESVVVERTGRFLYVADPGAHNVSMFPIDQTSGALGDEVAFAAGDQPVTVTLDPTGRFAYVVDFASDQVAVFSVDQDTGALNATGQVVTVGDEPYGMTVVAF